MPETILQRLQAYQDKQDTPERLAMFQGVGVEYYADAEYLNLLKEALIALYLAGPDSFDQNNIGRVISTGYLIPVPGTTTKENVVARLNAMALAITEKQTPVIVTIVQLSETFTAQRYKYLFKPGKGNWGVGGTTVEATHLELLVGENVQMGDAGIDANTVTISLGVLPDHTFLPTLNSLERNFSAEHSEYQVSYSVSGNTYVLFFKGTKGIYGGSGTQFIASQFSKLTNSDVAPYITYTSQLINNGDGVSPFATKAFVNGLEIEVNPATADLYLKNYDGTTLATINLAFLNNEGTTFIFNDATMSLELQNDVGEVLTAVPASAFVSNLIHQVDFKASVPEVLEFKGPSGTIIDSVTFTINNIQGLQTALTGKASKDGSNATGTWPIAVTGNAGSATNWGGSAADLSSDSSDLQKLVGVNGVNVARRYSTSTVKLWLAMAMTDISGLVTTLANMATDIALKANANGSNAAGTWPISVTGNAATATTANDTTLWVGLGRSAGNLLTPTYYMTMNSAGNQAGYTDVSQTIISLGINLKAEKDGSNATGTWPINIGGVASVANFVRSTGGDMKFYWQDGITAGVSPTWLLGGMNATDIYVYNPASLTVGVANQWKQLLTGNLNTVNGFKLIEGDLNAIGNPSGENWFQGWQVSTNHNDDYANQLGFSITGKLYTRTKYAGVWGAWSQIPFDENVLHKTLDETKYGNLALDIANGLLQFKVKRGGNTAALLGSGSGDTGLNGILQLFHTAGIENVRIYASGDSWINGGKLGIGTNTPEYLLDVKGIAKFGTGTVNEGTTKVLIVNESTAGKKWGLSAGIPGVSEAYFALLNITDGTIPIMIDDYGQIGIGVIAPGAKVHIANGPGGNQLKIQRGSGGALFGQALNEDGLILYNLAGTVVYQRWFDSGNVSIGSSTDNGVRLYVAGTGWFTGTVRHPEGTEDYHSATVGQMNSALLPKANDADVVHKTGTETIPGLKNFTNGLLTPDGAGPGYAASVNQLNATNSVVLGKADKLGTSDIEITDSTKGVILRSPNGSRFRVQVTNAGALTVTAI